MMSFRPPRRPPLASPLASMALCGLVATALAPAAAVAENRIDAQLPLAPELAAYGPLEIGVRPIDLVNPDQIDIVAIATAPAADPAAPLPTYDRPLRVSVWHPAYPGATGSRTLPNYLRDGVTLAPLVGRATRYAAPIEQGGPYPLVIVSHGYPGNRFLLSHLAENLASKGYVVASIDHTDSTYRTLATFGSTLRNRTLDQLFVLDEMARLNDDPASFLNGLVDVSRTAVVGYSMGGYGAVISTGAALADTVYELPFTPPAPTLDIHLEGNEAEVARPDPRVLTAIAIAPWGRNSGMFDADSATGISVPMLFVAGSEDDVSLYEGGVRDLFEEAVNADRALLTFDDANHNAAAPIPAPEESYAFSERLGFYPYEHYADAVWDTARMNNIVQHFATAWLGKYLKGETDKDVYLELVESSNDGVRALDEAGEPTEEETYWAGFPDRTAKGLRFERLAPGE